MGDAPGSGGRVDPSSDRRYIWQCMPVSKVYRPVLLPDLLAAGRSLRTTRAVQTGAHITMTCFISTLHDQGTLRSGSWPLRRLWFLMALKIRSSKMDTNHP